MHHTQGAFPFNHCLTITVLVWSPRTGPAETWFVARYENQDTLDQCIALENQIELTKFCTQYSIEDNVTLSKANWNSISRENAMRLCNETQHVFIFEKDVPKIM
jgi:hypothetical protein